MQHIPPPPLHSKPQILPNAPMPVTSINQESQILPMPPQSTQHPNVNNTHHGAIINPMQYPNAAFNKITPLMPDQNQNVSNNNIASAKSSSRGSNASGGNVSQGGTSISNQGTSKTEQRLTHEQVSKF